MPFPLPKAIQWLRMVYRTQDKGGGPAQLSPACLSSICSYCSSLCSDASALCNYLQCWNVLGSLPETTFLWLPFQHLPSIFSGGQPLWEAGLDFAHPGRAEDMSPGSKNIGVSLSIMPISMVVVALLFGLPYRVWATWGQRLHHLFL